MNFVENLTSTRVLWFGFIGVLICTVAFQVVVGQYGLILLDRISDPEQSRAAIASMSESQRLLHVWVTGTLDVAYPVAYGILFVGSAYRFFPKTGKLLAAPILLLVTIDLVEGVVQILGLTGVADWLDAKAILTPTKFLLAYIGILVTVSGWVAWIVRRFKP